MRVLVLQITKQKGWEIGMKYETPFSLAKKPANTCPYLAFLFDGNEFNQHLLLCQMTKQYT